MERIQRIEDDVIRNEYAVRAEQEKQRRESASQIDDFFEAPLTSFALSTHNARSYQHMTYLPNKSMPTTTEETPKLGIWDDIASSIQRLDPENVEMIGSLAAAAAINNNIPHIKVEVTDEPGNCDSFSNSILHSVTVKTEKLPPLHSPSSLQLMTPNSPYSNNCHTVPQHYHNYKASLYSSVPPSPRIMYPCPMNQDAEANSMNHLPRRTPPPPYPVPTATPVSRTTQRYNRRNNPELEKRRIHHCNFLGKS